LIAKPLPLKILQAVFAKSAPGAAFRREEGGGVPSTCSGFPKWNQQNFRCDGWLSTVFSKDLHSPEIQSLPCKTKAALASGF
jgi:hypothetical protein